MKGIKFGRKELRNAFRFDQVFDERDSLSDVYNSCVSTLAENLFTRTDSTVILYGPSKSGKSYSMRGNETNPIGFIFLFIKDLLSNIRKERKQGRSGF